MLPVCCYFIRLISGKLLTGVAAIFTMGGFLITLPLIVASGKNCIPADQREWINNRLAFVARSYGITMAQLFGPFADLLASDIFSYVCT